MWISTMMPTMSAQVNEATVKVGRGGRRKPADITGKDRIKMRKIIKHAGSQDAASVLLGTHVNTVGRFLKSLTADDTTIKAVRDFVIPTAA